MYHYKNIFKFIIPQAIYLYCGKLKNKFKWSRFYLKIFQSNKYLTLKKNASLKNCHKGERCFILGCGPSINLQNLKMLKKEKCITLNTFYVHKDYENLCFTYHLYSGLANHPDIPFDVGLKLYREMEEKLKADIVFLNYKDQHIITKYNLFKNKKIRYVDYTTQLGEIFSNGIDMSRPIYRVYNVAQVAIQIALYMGFKEIYLIGLDQDWVLRYSTKNKCHFFQSEETVLERDRGFDWNDCSWESLFWLHLEIWRQFGILKKFSEARGVKIYNATAGGILDVFPRVNYESLFVKRENKIKESEIV